jgi:hypothetical protein
VIRKYFLGFFSCWTVLFGAYLLVMGASGKEYLLLAAIASGEVTLFLLFLGLVLFKKTAKSRCIPEAKGSFAECVPLATVRPDQICILWPPLRQLNQKPVMQESNVGI